MLGTGLAGENLHVDEPWRQHVALAVDHLGAFRGVAPQMTSDVDDLSVGDENAARLVTARCRINDARIDKDCARGCVLCVRSAHLPGSSVRKVAGHSFEHGHADGDAHLDLLANEAA